MITENDLRAAIAECHGERNPTANTCIKLAAYYTILQNISKDWYDVSKSSHQMPITPTISIDSGSEFSQLVNGRDSNDVIPIIDELMDTLQMILPQLYNSVVRKLRSI